MRHRLSLWILSKAFSKSTWFMYNCLWHSVHCSMMLRRVKIWFVYPRPFRKPACSGLSRWSTASEIGLMMNLARILLKTDGFCWGQTERWLLSSCYGCSGLLSSKSSSWLPAFIRQVVASLPVLLQGVAEQLVLGCPVPEIFCFWGISSFSGSTVLTSRSVSWSSTSASIGRGGLFRTLVKCSAHLASTTTTTTTLFVPALN